MAGYWPSSSRKKKNEANSHLGRTNLVNKGFIIWLSGKCFLRDTAGSPERARWIHLARSGSQSQHAIWVIFLATRRAARNSQTWFAAHARVDLTRESGASRAYAYSRPSLPARVNAIRAGRRRTALFAGYPHTYPTNLCVRVASNQEPINTV